MLNSAPLGIVSPSRHLRAVILGEAARGCRKGACIPSASPHLPSLTPPRARTGASEGACIPSASPSPLSPP